MAQEKKWANSEFIGLMINSTLSGLIDLAHPEGSSHLLHDPADASSTEESPEP